MPRAIRFHLDEHVAHAIAAGLWRRGIDVTTTADANLLRADDGALVAFAIAQNRVIFTEDEDAGSSEGSQLQSAAALPTIGSSVNTGLLRFPSSRRWACAAR